MSATLPAHVLRPNDAVRNRGKSPARIAVEQALASVRGPLTRAAIAQRTELTANEVNRVISTMLAADAIHRNQARPAGYLLGPAPQDPGERVPARRTSPGGDYLGHELRPYTARPGAMRAFELPSLHNGAPIERRPPMLLGSTKPDARAQ